MIIECPACHTRYRTTGSLSITENTLFECSREQCGHVFPYVPESPQETGADPIPESAPGASPDVSVAESSPVSAQDPPPNPQSPLLHTTDPPSPLASVSKPSPPPKTPTPPQTSEDFAEDFSEPEDFALTPPSISSPTPSPSFSATSGKTRRDESIKWSFSSSSRLRQRSAPMTIVSVWPVLGSLVLLVFGYYLLGSNWRTNVADTEGMLARLPFVGSSFVASQFSPQNITLSDVKSGFWLTKDSKRVFAISGKATNNATVPASTIQIEGQLHNGEGETIEQRTISCGMGTAAENLPTLTTREINVLQGLVPPKQFHVPSGQSVNFLIVFPDPPKTVTELSCRVATAQFGTS